MAGANQGREDRRGTQVPARRSARRAKPPARPSRRQREVARRRRRRWAAGAAIAAVVVVLGVLVAVKVASSGSSARVRVAGSAASGKGGYGSSPAPSAVVAGVASLPSSLLTGRSASAGVTPARTVAGPALTAGGEPEVLYIGAEYCPYCAAERWAVVAALAKFGTWSNLGATHSASRDVYPNTATFSFYGAGYSSPWLHFTGVETTTNQPQGSGYVPLQSPSPAEAAVFQAKDPQGSIPFVDLGGKSVIVGASYDPQVLQGLSMAQIAGELRDPSTPVAKSVDTAAGMITRRLCGLTGDKPAGVCSAVGASGAG